MLTKTTQVFAHHGGLDLECDIYDAPRPSHSSPVFLFFHSGGLVEGSRESVPPWLVQVGPPPSSRITRIPY
ncbi:hypothetical protein IMZ48_11910 [Candidatus Bathyarchaeota archaeon]|nr:hypothetical protein [Candidatus Bathyarchaeota archaeon]